jgi:uncharacterized protein (TIGR00369 family)
MEFKPKNINFKERVERHLAKQNFMHHIEFSLHKIEAGYTEGEMKLKPIHHQQDGFAHGGLVATIADIVAGFAAYTLVGSDRHVVTGEIKISYFAKGDGNILRAHGKVVKPGKRVNFCEAEVYSVKDSSATLIAKASTSMIII